MSERKLRKRGERWLGVAVVLYSIVFLLCVAIDWVGVKLGLWEPQPWYIDQYD